MKKALLIVASPFQLINVRAALEHFRIKEYNLYILKDNHSDRHKQIVLMAEYYQMEYDLLDYRKVVYINKWHFVKNFMSLFLPYKNAIYDIIIHGDYRNVYPLISFYPLLKKEGKICFVDDGNATINVFKGKDIAMKEQLLYYLLKVVMKLDSIKPFDYLTIYSDVDTNLFNVIPNNLLVIDVPKISDNITYILGTNTLLHAKYNATSVSVFLSYINVALKDIINTPNVGKIMFLPHGREQSPEIEDMCREYNIEYKKLDECVESFFVKQDKYPKCVYGFGSSALFNLKKMYPSCECVNLYIKGNIEEHNAIYDEINTYYEKHGILLKELTNV